MFDRFDDRTLEIATVIVVVVIALVILCYLAIYINPQVFFNPFKPPTPTAVAQGEATPPFGVLWTDTPTPTNTPIPSATATWTATATPTDTPTPTATWTPTPTSTSTPVPPTATKVPTRRPPPRPTNTPLPPPYYWIPCTVPGCEGQTGGRPDCRSTWVHGYVVGADGLGEANVQMRVGNDQGWRADTYTDANGHYQFQFAQQPIAGRFFVRVFKGGQARSDQYWWSTSVGCTGPYSLQEMQVSWRHR